MKKLCSREQSSYLRIIFVNKNNNNNEIIKKGYKFY